MPKVSICIPAYGDAEILKRALDSIITQKYEDYEIIVTDDSPDSTVCDLISRYIPYAKLRYFKNTIPLGSPENWNYAVKLSRGEFIKILHHDDWFSTPTSLGEFVEMLVHHPDAGIGFSGVIIQSALSGHCRHHFATKRQVSTLRLEPTCLFYGNFLGPPSATIIRRSAFVDFDRNLVWVVDIFQYIEIILRNGFVSTSSALIFNEIDRPNQITRRCENNIYLNIYEYFYLYKKICINIPEHIKKAYLNHLLAMVRTYDIKSESEIRAAGCGNDIPDEIRFALSESSFTRKYLLTRYRMVKRSKSFLNKLYSYIFT